MEHHSEQMNQLESKIDDLSEDLAMCRNISLDESLRVDLLLGSQNKCRHDYYKVECSGKRLT
jgi:hypothetical protein